MASCGARRRLLSTALPPGLQPAPGLSPLRVVKEGIDAGILRHDAKQMAALTKLDRLAAELRHFTPPPLEPPPAPSGAKQWRGPQFDAYGQPVAGGTAYTGVDAKGGLDNSDSAGGLWSSLTSLFSRDAGENKAKASVEPTLDGVKAPLGLYMYGGVGCGKTLLMDTFFACAAVPDAKKRRMHFNEFMLDVHRRMHEIRTKAPDSGDPVPLVAHGIASSTTLLCFDEFQVTDVADALVMRRLFRRLFAHGLVMVATSNRPPDQLYLNGLQRPLFLPFIDDLKARCECHDLESTTDYRMLAEVSRGRRTYLTPLGEETAKQIDEFFIELSKGGHTTSLALALRGRTVTVPRAASHAAIARFKFDELCGRPLGAEDYLGIASAFHTVFVEDVPQLTRNDINRVRRLITLVDAFYDKKVRLIVSAQVPMEKLYLAEGDAGDVTAAHGDLIGTATYVPDTSDEAFAFDRTLSRLIEMSSHEYLVRSVASHEQNKGGALLLYQSESVLSQEQALELFRGYDSDGSGYLEEDELKLLMMDLSERMRGHRNVEETEVKHAMSLMDVDGNGEVSQYEFVDIFANSTFTQVVRAYGETLPDDTIAPRGRLRRARSSRVSRGSSIDVP